MTKSSPNALSLFQLRDTYTDGPSAFSKPQYEYLATSGRPEAVQIRATLERWFSKYPAEARSDLSSRFCSPGDGQHVSAFFELALHELCRCLGCAVLPHPDVPGVQTHPDFLVTPASGEPFYLEAVATGESPDEVGARKRTEVVYDALNRMESPNFFIGMDVLGSPATPPPVAALRRFLEKQLASLDPDKVPERVEERPHWSFKHDGWEVVFFPIPKSQQARGRGGVRPLGIQMSPAMWVDSPPAIRNVLEAKAKRYGASLERAYVVAVNGTGVFLDDIDVEDALFGSLVFESVETSEGFRSRWVRAPDGVFWGPKGPRNQLVSAVLMATRATPWSLDCGARLYLNPFAQQPAPETLKQLPQTLVVDRTFRRLPGRSLKELLGLPLRWPADEPAVPVESE